MAHVHNVIDTDPHFTIDPDTRSIISQYTGRLVLIQGDHNSERFTFELPRWVDGHDMLDCNQVEVHYVNIGEDNRRNSGMYKVTDLHLKEDDSDTVVCTWLISYNATKYAGSLSFVLRYTCTVGAIVEYAWLTAVYSGVSIATGINNSDAIADTYADVLQNWYSELLMAGTVGVNKVEEARDKAIEAIQEVSVDAVGKVAAEDVLPIVVNAINHEIDDAKEEALAQISTQYNKIVKDVLARLPIAEEAKF